MEQQSDEFSEKLLEKGILTEPQLKEIKDYKALNIFSLHNELNTLLYLSVLLFTSGIGIIIYNNIDSIGHEAILSLLFVLTVVGYYFCYKKSVGFQNAQTYFESPFLNYLVLLCTILSCIILGYFQYQYHVLGYNWTTLLGCILSFFCAYYFDNKSALSIGITGLATFVGITITPKTLIDNEIYSNPMLSYYGLVLGILFLVWSDYANKINLKRHFSMVYLTFALHLISICCIAGLLEDYWILFVFLQGIITLYFYKISYKNNSVSLFGFTLIYGFIGLNIFLSRIAQYIDFSIFEPLLIMIAPMYFIGAIIGFILLIKQFNKKKNDSSK